MKLRMNFHQKLLSAIVFLLLLVGITSSLAIQVSSDRYFTQAAQKQLETSVKVAREYLQKREEQLAVAVDVLVKDFGFKAAVATQDTETVDTAILNQGARIGADLIVVTDLDGQITNDPYGIGQQMNLALGVQGFNGRLFRTIVRPIEVPDQIGWVVVGFALDKTVAEEIASLTGAEVSFLDVVSASAPISSRPDLSFAGLVEEIGNTQQASAYLSRKEQLESAGRSNVAMVLQVSNQQASDAASNLTQQLGSIFAVALALCLAVGMWFARRISNPVGVLIDAAKRIRSGNYDEPVEVEGGGEIAILGTAINTMVEGIAEREQKISTLAFEEPVTGLPNRIRFRDRYQHAEDAFSVAVYELIDHKDIDFSYGVEAGLEYKAALMAAFSAQLPQQCELYAFSNYQFAVVLPQTDADLAIREALRLAERLEEKQHVQGADMRSAVAGALMSYPDEADDIDELLHRLDATLERAVEGQARCLTYLAEEEAVRMRQLSLISSFDRAFQEGEFFLVFQPKVHLASNRVLEAETLIRWVHPEHGFVPPDEFILLAERSGNIGRLTQWVLNGALKQIATWREEGFDIRLAVNIAADDLNDPSFSVRLKSMLDQYGLKGESLTLELTENSVIANQGRVLEVLLQLKRLGITLSIDDFGTGFSSLSQLKSLPFDELKIDKSFVLELDKSNEDQQIVNSTLSLGHNLGLSVVAEGVENQQSLELLHLHGCDKVQGFFFSKPLEKDEFVVWSKQFNEQNQTILEKRA